MVYLDVASVAQWIEQDPSKVLVGSSNLPWGTIWLSEVDRNRKALNGKVVSAVRSPVSRDTLRGAANASRNTVLLSS